MPGLGQVGDVDPVEAVGVELAPPHQRVLGRARGLIAFENAFENQATKQTPKKHNQDASNPSSGNKNKNQHPPRIAPNRGCRRAHVGWRIAKKYAVNGQK